MPFKYNIALIVTYFGELPFWFPAFQLSCSYNYNIQWIFFSDAQPPLNLPRNITFINFSINDFCQLASKKLCINIQLSEEFLYKICDFKPAFGIIYEDYLHSYDFWGHCDVDIIWGQINNYIKPNIFEKYDIITSREKRISGHFCLYRNERKINRIFLEMPWTAKFLQKIYSYEHLDEEYFTNYLHWLKCPTSLSRIKRFFTGQPFIPIVYWDKVLTTSGKHQCDLIENKKKFIYKKQKVYHADGTETMYLHFHVLKKLPTFKKCDISCNDTTFYVSDYGISRE